MNFSDKKIEISILSLSLLLVVGLGYLFKTPVQNAVTEIQEIIYEMPRPKNSFLAALFSLGDREISRTYKNPFVKKKADDKKAAEVAKATPAKSVAAKKTEPKKIAKKDDKNAKKKVEVAVVGGVDEKKWSAEAELSGGSFGGTGQVAYNETGANNKNPTTLQDKNDMSGAQWRALLAAQPTKENVAKLLQAYEAKDIDDQAFYTIVTDLYRNNKSEVQLLGLAAVRAVYNVKSFSLTAEYYDQLAKDVQPQAHAYLLTYAVTPRLPILAAALKSSNSNVVEAAMEVVLLGHKNAMSGVNLNTDPRNARGDVQTNSVSGYAKFIPIFQQLALSSDPAIAGLANTALSQIQTNVAAL
ncbi:MAG: hypothetical protein HUU57_01405 [Bdellovibrio sp.]|nr:hypothetical protein [Bdellovibrio sp.]